MTSVVGVGNWTIQLHIRCRSSILVTHLTLIEMLGARPNVGMSIHSHLLSIGILLKHILLIWITTASLCIVATHLHRVVTRTMACHHILFIKLLLFRLSLCCIGLWLDDVWVPLVSCLIHICIHFLYSIWLIYSNYITSKFKQQYIY